MGTAGDTTLAIPIRNVWYMLLYAWNLPSLKNKKLLAPDCSPTLVGLLGTLLAWSTERLLARRRLRPYYKPHRQFVRGIRGHIDFIQSLQQLSFQRGEVHCHFSELSLDNIKNRIIRGSLLHLARSDLPFFAGESRKNEDELRQRLLNGARHMEGVAIIRVRPSDFRTVVLARGDTDYALPLAICEMLVRFKLPTEASGDLCLYELLRDELTMHDVFERFVRNFYRHWLRDTHVVSNKYLRWPAQHPRLPSMHPDLTIEPRGNPTGRRLVLDTKYYKEALVKTPHDDVEKFISSHLYQLYAYVRSQEHYGFLNTEGILLYPTVDHELDEQVQLHDHVMRIATLDLSREWPEIESRLADLVQSIV
jgi:5-methylcytosine-specific restriction enzyme subunit McrC